MVCFPSSRQTQWDPPTWDSPGDDASLEHEAEMDLGTPTYDENPMKVRGTNLWDRPRGGRAVWSWKRDRSDPRSFGVAPLATLGSQLFQPQLEWTSLKFCPACGAGQKNGNEGE